MQLPLGTFRGIRKPPGSPRLNPSHPLLNGCVGCIPLSEGGASWDLINGVPWGPADNAKWLNDPLGVGVTGGGGTSKGFIPLSTTTIYNLKPMSLLTVFRPTAADFNTFNGIASIGMTGSDQGILLQFVSTTLTFRCGGVNISAVSAASGSQLCFGGGGVDGANNGFVYFNGTYTTGASADPAYAGGTVNQIGGDYLFANRAFNGWIGITLIYNFKIPQWMCDLFRTDPFGMLIYPEDDIFAELVGAGLIVLPGGAWGSAAWGRRAWGLPPLVAGGVNSSAVLRRNTNLEGASTSGPFFANPLG